VNQPAAAAGRRPVHASAHAAPHTAPSQAPARPRPDGRHLRVVESPRLTPLQRRRRARAFLLVAGGLAVLVAFGLVYLHVVLAQRQFELDRVTTQVRQQQVLYQRRRLEVAQLGSPQHVISTAEGRLGMRPPTSVDYLVPAAVATGGSRARQGTSDQAPAGDANWPQIKSELAGGP